jgi:ketosteroid isomerase-like protein
MSGDAKQFRDIAHRLTRAHHAKDAQGILECYAQDALIYDLAPPLCRRGFGRESLDSWLATWQGPIVLDIEVSESRSSGDLAILSALNRMRERKVEEEDVDLWFRTTTALLRQGRSWVIVHEHASVPIHMDGSYRAAIDLRPIDDWAGTGAFSVASPAPG